MTKDFCQFCGGYIPKFTKSPRKFCSLKCRDLYNKNCHSLPVKKTIRNSFNLFKNIVAVSDSPDEFNQLYSHYFGGNKP